MSCVVYIYEYDDENDKNDFFSQITAIMDSTTTMTTNTGFPVEKSGRRGASSSGAQISNNTPLSSPSFLIKKSLRPVVAKLLGVNANSNDQEQQHQAAEEQQQQQANKKMSGNVGQKRTRANNKQQ